jgi:hypothetical protein
VGLDKIDGTKKIGQSDEQCKEKLKDVFSG